MDDGRLEPPSELVSEAASRNGCTWQLLLLLLVALVVLIYIAMSWASGTDTRFTRGNRPTQFNGEHRP